MQLPKDATDPIEEEPVATPEPEPEVTPEPLPNPKPVEDPVDTGE